MKLFPKFKSKNLTVFVYTAVILLVYTLLMFGYIVNYRVPTNNYIALSFSWLCIIISASFYYMSSYEKADIKRKIKFGTLIYCVTTFVVNFAFINFFSYKTLIAVDFVITFVILISFSDIIFLFLHIIHANIL